MKKLLVSPGYGAGWSTWNSGEVGRFMATYQPIIEFIESGNRFNQDEIGRWGSNETHPLLQQLIAECQEKFGVDYVCVLGADDLEVAIVDDNTQVRIEEYDGYESLTYKDEVDWI